jgi:HPt (histidine-containing phosphotransfer) domain-containing protein
MTDAVIDKATFEALEQSTGADFAKELVDTFLVEAPDMLKTLRQAFADKNVELFRRTAHSLKSNSNTFGATKLGSMAKDLELGAADAVKASSPAALDALGTEYARVAEALKALRNA